MSYLSLFAAAFLAATLVPAQSEALLAYLLLDPERSVALLLWVATFGNVLGSCVNWGLGRGLRRFQGRKWFPFTPKQMSRAQGWYHRFGRWSLLASWVPVIGDPITLIAGVMREPILPFVLIVTLAKAGRYIVVATVTLNWV